MVFFFLYFFADNIPVTSCGRLGVTRGRFAYFARGTERGNISHNFASRNGAKNRIFFLRLLYIFPFDFLLHKSNKKGVRFSQSFHREKERKRASSLFEEREGLFLLGCVLSVLSIGRGLVGK